MFAATCPTSWRSTPVTVMCVCLSIDDVDPRGDVEHHRVRVAEREDDLLALDLRAVADADDVELALEAVGHAGHGVGDQAPGQTVKLRRAPGSSLARVATQMPVGELEVDAARERLPSLPFGPCTSTAPSSTLTVTPLGIVIGFFPIRDMSLVHRPYQMLHSTSPPTPALTASRPVITPREVVRMLVPSPASTSGTSSRPK